MENENEILVDRIVSDNPKVKMLADIFEPINVPLILVDLFSDGTVCVFIGHNKEMLVILDNPAGGKDKVAVSLMRDSGFASFLIFELLKVFSDMDLIEPYVITDDSQLLNGEAAYNYINELNTKMAETLINIKKKNSGSGIIDPRTGQETDGSAPTIITG